MSNPTQTTLPNGGFFRIDEQFHFFAPGKLKVLQANGDAHTIEEMDDDAKAAGVALMSMALSDHPELAGFNLNPTHEIVFPDAIVLFRDGSGKRFENLIAYAPGPELEVKNDPVVTTIAEIVAGALNNKATVEA